MSIIGQGISGPPAVPDFDEKNENAGGYIKNKPNMEQYLKRTGGTMTGPLNLVNPTQAQNGATKNYVDEKVGETLSSSKSYTDAKHFLVTVTITASGWSGSAPYTQTVTVAGVVATDCPHVAPVYSATLSTAKAQKEAWEKVSKAVATAGGITFTCFEDKPTTNIPIQVEVNR